MTKKGMIEQLVRERVNSHPDAVWLRFNDETYTWSEVLDASVRVANGLLDLGVAPGDRVAIMMGNRPEFLWTFFASSFIGASVVPINISQRGPTLAHILTDSGVSAAVAHADLITALDSVQKANRNPLHVVVVGSPGDPDTSLPKGYWSFDRVISHDATEIVLPDDSTTAAGGAAMLYTSGTTGPPKGVVSSGSDGVAGLLAILGSLSVRPGDTIYTSLPLFHGNALMISMLGSILLDAQFALGERFRAATHFDECRRFGAAEFNALGGMIALIMKQPTSPMDRAHQVRTVLSAGCPADLWRSFEDRFGVRLVEFYGLVDAPGLLLNDVGKVGSMGRPVGDTEFRILDDDDHPLSPGQVGELAFRGPGGASSYYNNRPDDTKVAWRGGWFHTGDLAVEDSDGFFFYRGRKKESIRRLGENISAWEIETVVAQHPDVLECAAHAVPSELGEDEVKLCVIPRPGAQLDPAALVGFCENRMAKYAIPRFVEVMDALPKTPSQRVQYAALRKRGVTSDTWDRRALQARSDSQASGDMEPIRDGAPPISGSVTISHSEKGVS